MANASSSPIKSQLPFELVYQVVALIVAIILVHLIYITVIRPNADAILAAQAERVAQGEEYVQDRSLYVVLKDFEQETCFILMLWAMAIMGYKGRAALRERALLSEDIVSVSEGMSILPGRYPGVHPGNSGATKRDAGLPAAESTDVGATAVCLHAQRAGRF